MVIKDEYIKHVKEMMETDNGIIHRGDPYIREQAKISRNESCPCGSGKKYKKCCR